MVTSHEWEFLGMLGRNETPIIVGVCEVCGLTRRAVVRDGRHMDLRGECPGEPQDPGAPTPPMVG